MFDNECNILLWCLWTFYKDRTCVLYWYERLVLQQGPLRNTCGHFWLMIWEQCSKAVLMLNRIIEKGSVSIPQHLLSLLFWLSASARHVVINQRHWYDSFLAVGTTKSAFFNTGHTHAHTGGKGHTMFFKIIISWQIILEYDCFFLFYC